MATHSHFSTTTPNTIICLFLLVTISLGCANSARILEEVGPASPDMPQPSDSPASDIPDLAPAATPTTTSSSGQIPAITTGSVVAAGSAGLPPPNAEAPDTDTSDAADVAPTAATSVTGPTPVTAAVAPTAGPIATSADGPALETHVDMHHPQLTFFMHDILGGSHPSGRVVTGIIASSDASGVPFSKPNGGVFPINSGVPLVNGNNPMENNNNAPVLASLNGVQSSTNTFIQDNSNKASVAGGGNNQPFVTAGQLPPGATLQQLMFGSITVVDDELTEGHELGTNALGRAQGFYLASSLDGTSQTVAITAMFHGSDHHDEEEDSLSFFGIHRSGSPESQIAIIGGTGKYENAKGYANIETLHHEDQHTTDGVETILQFSIYLSA